MGGPNGRQLLRHPEPRAALFSPPTNLVNQPQLRRTSLVWQFFGTVSSQQDQITTLSRNLSGKLMRINHSLSFIAKYKILAFRVLMTPPPPGEIPMI